MPSYSCISEYDSLLSGMQNQTGELMWLFSFSGLFLFFNKQFTTELHKQLHGRRERTA